MKYANPLPIMHEHCGLKKSHIPMMLGYHRMTANRLQSLATMAALRPKPHARLFFPAMVAWGECKDRDAKQALWECYFDADTKPHIYHILCWEHSIPDETIMRHAGFSQSTLRKILKRPKVTKLHLQAIARFAMEYRDALASKKQRGGPDPRYMKLHRALTDPKRLYEPGEIIAD